MKIHIDDTKDILSIQKEFSANFPFLKIEFFSKPHKKGIGTERKYMKVGSVNIGECRTKHTSGELDISSDMTVHLVEKKFAEIYGLYVQVFRRSGKLWLETTATDSWTLDYQNVQGQELSSGSLNDTEEIDYHKQE